MAAPLTINIHRNGVAESSHIVHGIALDARGVIGAWGDVTGVIYPRSTLKPIQALPLVETGAAEKFGLSEQEIALACASHNAEESHVALAQGWLEKIGLTESDLECGAHWPKQKEDEYKIACSGKKPCNLHNNCSGKHLGMLTSCLHNGWPTAGYTEADHPLQRRILATFAELAEYDLKKMTIGIDGCSAPNPALPLENIARAFLNLMQRPAGNLLLSAMSKNPFYVAGTERFDTALMQAAPEKLVSKIGAEGSLVIFNLPQKSVLYLKCQDGAGRAVQAAAGKVLLDMKWIADDTAIAEYTRPVLKNWRGIVTGDIGAVSSFT